MPVNSKVSSPSSLSPLIAWVLQFVEAGMAGNVAELKALLDQNADVNSTGDVSPPPPSWLPPKGLQ